jgi:hypothetical protein
MKRSNLSIVKSNEIQTDITVTDNGASFVSFREHASRIGIATNTLKSYCQRVHPNVNTRKGLSEFLQSQSTQYYAYKCRSDYRTKAAGILLDKTSIAGFRAYNYAVLNIPLATLELEQTKVKLRLVEDKLEKVTASRDLGVESDLMVNVVGNTNKAFKAYTLTCTNKKLDKQINSWTPLEKYAHMVIKTKYGVKVKAEFYDFFQELVS